MRQVSNDNCIGYRARAPLNGRRRALGAGGFSNVCMWTKRTDTPDPELPASGHESQAESRPLPMVPGRLAAPLADSMQT